MTLDEYLASRFGPVFDALNDVGGVPEELMECLKRGAVWELAEQLSSDAPAGVPNALWIYFDKCLKRAGDDRASVWITGSSAAFNRRIELPVNDPDRIFPYLSHLIEQESLT